MTRQQFRELRHGARIRDRGGRVWIVHAPAHQRDGRDLVTLRAGPLVRHVEVHWGEDYMLLLDADAAGT